MLEKAPINDIINVNDDENLRQWQFDFPKANERILFIFSLQVDLVVADGVYNDIVR